MSSFFFRLMPSPSFKDEIEVEGEGCWHTTRIMKSKGQRPFSSTRAVRVFWHFLPEIEYWGPLNSPKFEY